MTTFYPRHVLPRLMDALTDTPVVLLHGPRQSGKTTLARHVGQSADYHYISFDDDNQRMAAQSDPVGYTRQLSGRVILDEVQRVPELFTSLKLLIDEDRIPGRFLMTGSANVLLVPQLADSLAGRMEILRLHPLSQSELHRREKPDFLNRLFEEGFPAGRRAEPLASRLPGLVASGGFPAALLRNSPTRRQAWYRDYVDTLIQRDVQDLAAIRSLHALPRLLALAAGQTAHLLNISELAGPFHISRPTIREYVTLLSHVFLLEELQPWSSNRMRRLIKTPKIHLGDTGLACSLLGLAADDLASDRTLLGQLLETFVYQELRRQASCLPDPIRFYHYRDKDQVEVDIILQKGRRLAGIKVKASATVTTKDFKGLRLLERAHKDVFTSGILLYDGDSIVPFGERLHAVPISYLW